MNRFVFGAFGVVFLLGCPGTQTSLDCSSDPERICNTSVGAICDAEVNRCRCQEDTESCPCVTHAQCQSMVCDFSVQANAQQYETGNAATRIGTCVPKRSIVYANPSANSSCTDAKKIGDKDCRYSSLHDALDSARRNQKPFVQMVGELNSSFDVVFDYPGQTRTDISIVGTYDHVMPDFLPEASRPALSVIHGMTIDQKTKIAAGVPRIVLDAMVLAGPVVLSADDALTEILSVEIKRSKLDFTGDKELFSVKNVNVAVSQSLIQAKKTPLFSSSALSANGSMTEVNNSVFAITNASEPLFTKYEGNGLRLYFNSFDSPSLTMGFCRDNRRTPASFQGNLFETKIKEDCTAKDLITSGWPIDSSAEFRKSTEQSELFSCGKPYVLDAESPLKITCPEKECSLSSASTSIKWDFCNKLRNESPYFRGALLQG